MISVVFVLLLILVVVIGAITIARLIKSKQTLMAAVFFVAFVAIIVILYVSALSPPSTTLVQSTAIPGTWLEAVLWATPFYIAIFGYAILSFIFLATINFSAMAVQAILFLFFAPYLFFYYRNYLTLSMLFTMGSLLACTFMALVRVLLVYGGRSNRSVAAGLGKNDRPMGFDTFSHLLFYVTLLTLLAASGFCFDLQAFGELLAIGFITASGGAVGILTETNNYKLTLRDRIK